MNIPNISGALNAVRSYITVNSPVLLLGTAVAGVVTTGVLAAKAGYNARGIIDEHEDLTGEETTLQEKAQLTWLCYAAPAVTGATTIASCIGMHTVHNKRHAALAGLYAMSTTKLEDYQTKAEELLGAKKTQQLTNEMAQAEVDKHPLSSHEVILTNGGSELCYDEFSGRYFYGSVNKIEEAVNNTNALLNTSANCSVDLNDFYDYVGLPPIPIGQDVGWTGKHMDVEFGSVLAEGRPAISYKFRRAPEAGHDSFR